MSQPFRIIPWNANFIERLTDCLLERTDGRPGDAVLIFPHKRPARYVLEALRHKPGLAKPCLVPRMFAAREVFAQVRQAAVGSRREPGLLDRVAIMQACVTEVARQAAARPGASVDWPEPAQRLSELLDDMGPGGFFPWGRRLVNLIEEFWTHGLEPEDYQYMAGEVSPFAAMLLANLGRIHEACAAAFEDHGWTSPGYDAFCTARALREGKNADALFQGAAIFIAGFAALSGAEDILLKQLWNDGATVCLHSDPAGHWSCRVHGEWMKRWKARGEVYGDVPERTPRITFYEGYDLHSQLALLPELLNHKADTPARGQAATAVVLPDTALLLPVLHHMPDKDVNISMGYPFDRSALAQLLEKLLALQESRTEDGGYARKPFAECLRHPYLRMLHATDAVLLPLLDSWEAATTPAALATAITELCALLLEQGGLLWERFALDAECLFLLMQRVVPELRDCKAAYSDLGQDVLFTVLRELLAAQRVPFEAEPLTGTQVLGMLETRLLCFDRVILLDATEDKLPGAGGQDPLLPESLRALAGLPDNAARDRVAAYNFFRLIAGADEVALLYQNGETQSGLFDEKKTASRFVEELIWKDEQRKKALLGPNESPRHAVRQRVRPFSSTPMRVEKSPAVRARLAEFLEKPLSPSTLNVYLQCPVRFFHTGPARLKALELIEDGPDPAGTGNLLHESLRRFYEPRLGRPFFPEASDADELGGIFRSLLAQSDLPDRLPPDSRIMLEAAGPERLRRYLLKQAPGSVPLMVEADLSAELLVNARPRTLIGRLDRVDLREEGAMLIDYKSGSVILPERGLWTDESFWQRLADWTPDSPDISDISDDPLAEAAERVKSLQLPCYLHLYGQDAEGLCPSRTEGLAGGQGPPTGSLSRTPPAWNAALVELRDDGEEVTLFASKMEESDRRTALAERIPGLLHFVLRHMEEAPAFLPNPGRQCGWCFCREACMSALSL